jgi:hypothetical protein
VRDWIASVSAFTRYAGLKSREVCEASGAGSLTRSISGTLKRLGSRSSSHNYPRFALRYRSHWGGVLPVSFGGVSRDLLDNRFTQPSASASQNRSFSSSILDRWRQNDAIARHHVA